MRQSKSYKALEHHKAYSKDTAIDFKTIYYTQLAIFQFKKDIEPTYSYNILSGNLHQEITKRKSLKIARFKKHNRYHYYILSRS